MQDWKITDSIAAGVEFAGLKNDGLEDDGLEFGTGLENDGLHQCSVSHYAAALESILQTASCLLYIE